jgi:hypothetical protein
MRRPELRRLGLCVALAALGGCAAAPGGPIERLDPAELTRLQSAAPRGPLSLDEIIARSPRTPPEVLVEEIRRSATHPALSAAEAAGLRARGVAASVVDALNEADARWQQDQAAAARVAAAQQAAAQAEAQARDAQMRRRAAYPYPYPYPYADPGFYAPGVSIGVGVRR